MNIGAARAKLTKLAKGEYRSIQQEIIDYKNGPAEERYTLYLANYGHYTGNSWEKAFEALEEGMKGGKNSV